MRAIDLAKKLPVRACRSGAGCSTTHSLTGKGPRNPKTGTENATCTMMTGSATGAVGVIGRGTWTGRASVTAVTGAGTLITTTGSTAREAKEGSTVIVPMTVAIAGAVIVMLKEETVIEMATEGIAPTPVPVSKSQSSPNSLVLVATGTITNTDDNALGTDGKPLSDYVEVLVDYVVRAETKLPHGRLNFLKSATAKCIPWPRININMVTEPPMKKRKRSGNDASTTDGANANSQAAQC